MIENVQEIIVHIQVMHSQEGWQSFRSNYGVDMFRYLASTYPKAPWILSSATLDDDSITEIVQSLGTKRFVWSVVHKNLRTYFRDKYKVIYMDCNRGNIYQQQRRISKSLKIGYVLGWFNVT